MEPSTMEALDTPPLEALLMVLLESCQQTPGSERIRRSVEDVAQGDWMSEVTDAGDRLGLRMQWISATPAEAAALARPDLPVFTASADGLGQSTWWVLDGAGAGRVRATPIGDPRGGRWLTRGQLTTRLGPEERPWALVEPLLPASPMAAREGQPTPSPFRRLVGLLRLERDDLAAIAAYSVAVGVLSLATPLVMQVLINWLAFGALLQPVLVLGVALLVFLAVAAGMSVLQRVAVETVQRRVFVRMAADLAGRLSRIDVASFDRAYGPELVNRFFDVLTVQKAVRSLLLDGLAALLQAVVGLLLLALYHPLLLAFDVMVLIAIVVVWFPLGIGAAKTAVAESKMKYKVAGWIEEMARHPLLFKLGGSQLGPDRADALVRGYLEARAAHFAVFIRQYVGMQVVQVVVSTSLLILCGWLVLQGQLTLGQLVAAEFIVTSALTGLAKFTDKLDTYYDLLAAVDKLGTLVDLPTERVTGISRQAAGHGAVVGLDDVAFAYPGSPGGLSGISLNLPAQSHTAVLAPPGVGKSTVADLILGVRVPSAGSVMRDGVDARALRPDTLYRDVALLRASELIDGTLRDNLALGRPGVGGEEALRCLDKVGLAGVVAKLPDGLDTRLSPTGAPLSEGHIRALVVARALAGSPRLIVVDGFLDGVGHSAREELLTPLLASSATVVVFTEDDALSRRLDRVFELSTGGLSERPSV
ncbi:MAG: putative ABC transport system ATP-binding protein [Myxococcota bacterium]|jgi:putative ABC transport system ATP-binding protein